MRIFWFAFYCYDLKPQTKAVWGAKGLFSLHNPTYSLLREAKAGTGRQELKQKPCKKAPYWIIPYGLLTTQDHLPTGNTSHSKLSFSTSITNQEKFSHNLVHRPV